MEVDGQAFKVQAAMADRVAIGNVTWDRCSAKWDICCRESWNQLQSLKIVSALVLTRTGAKRRRVQEGEAESRLKYDPLV